MIPRLQQLREPSYRDQRFVESLYDPIAFDRLLRIAEAGWLRKTPDYTDIDTELDHPEAKLIEQLGVGGLRAARRDSFAACLDGDLARLQIGDRRKMGKIIMFSGEK